MVRRKAYLSGLHVRSERRLAALNPRLDELASRLKSLLPTSPGATPFEATAITIGPDPDASDKPGAFRFERAVGAAWSENRYYSQAPLETDVHLEVLNEFEDLLVG